MIPRLISLILLFSSHGILAQELYVRDPWIASSAPGINNHSGYLVLVNNSEQLLGLRSISSPVFSSVEIHRSVTVNNITRMHAVENPVIPARGRLEFKPGDFHLMLYNADRTLRTGDIVPLIFTFSDNTTLTAKSPVRNMTEMFEQSPDTRKTSNRPDRVAGVLSSYQYLLPHHLLSGLMYRLTRLTWRPFKNLFINAFISWFDVDMSIARTSDPRRYDTFNAFFTRQLVPGARPVEQRPGSIVSPVDGSVSQYGRIHEDRLLQAKGRDFTLSALLGGDEVLASRFKDGEFITLYLSPRDYHRIHMPVSGELQSMIYLPGSLFSVSPTTARGIDRLYARNERVINIFDTEMGAMALIMVGAIFVGSMETVWAGQITPASDRRQFVNDYTGRDEAIHLNRGDEAGRFNMGSTVILLFERNKLTWDKGLAAASGVRMGELIAQQRDQQDDP